MKLTSSVVIASVALLSVACKLPASSKKADDSQTGTTTTTSASLPKGGVSCNQVQAGTCTEFTKEDPLGLLEGMCKDVSKGSFKKEACPSANLLGTCELKDHKSFYYFGGEYPWVADAKEACEKNGLEPGKFTASPNAEQTAKDKALPAPEHIPASCTDSTTGICEDLYGELLELQTSSCEGTSKLAKAPCPTEKLVGSCVKQGKTQRHYEGELKHTKLAQLQKDCESYAIPFGHWYPNPDFKEPAKKAKKKAKKPAAE